MTGRSFAERLVAAGLDPLEIPAKAALFDAVRSALQDSTSAAPHSVTWVPGRLEVFGTHTDYAGGRTLVSALPRGFAFAGRRRTDGVLRVVDVASGLSMSMPASGTPRPSSGWRRYVEVVVQRLARNFPGAELGADLAFASDLPQAAGMSSSSALMVGVASTLVRLSGARERPEWLADISTPLDEAGYYACVENGRTFGQLAGDAGVGTHGGSEDHAAMVCGAAGALSEYAFVPMRRLSTVAVPDEWRLVVASSGVAAEKTGGALESYNRLSADASALLDIWNGSHPPQPSLAAALASADSAAAELREALRASRSATRPTARLDARLQHFVREDARLPAAVRAFRDRDELAASALAEDSQSDSERLLLNQVAETAALARLGRACGAFATRSFGAGFGGSVWALAHRDAAAPMMRCWLDAYLQRHPGARAVAFPAQPAPPLMELEPA